MTAFENPEYNIFSENKIFRQMIEILGLRLQEDPLDGIFVLDSSREDVQKVLEETRQLSQDNQTCKVLIAIISLASSTSWCRFNARPPIEVEEEYLIDYRSAHEIAAMGFWTDGHRIKLTLPSVTFKAFPRFMEGGFFHAP